VAEVRELGHDPRRSSGEELQRDPGLLGLVGEVLALAARVRDRADPAPARRLRAENTSRCSSQSPKSSTRIAL
jgi:hypothetical protein